MRKLILALTATVAFTSVAHADEWRYRRFEGPRPGYGYPHREYRGYQGGDNGGAIIGGLVGGMILGGMLNQIAQPRYVAPQPVCQKVFVGNVVVDGQTVEAYKTVCN